MSISNAAERFGVHQRGRFDPDWFAADHPLLLVNAALVVFVLLTSGLVAVLA